MKLIYKIVKKIFYTTIIFELANIASEYYSRKKTDYTEEIYNWKHGNIHYRKTGEGSPILLIHDIDIKDNSEKLLELQNVLEEKHTVYSIDLLGCGNSEKPVIEYTNYLYVQLITDFANDIIKEKATTITFRKSSPFVIMAASIKKDIFKKIIFVQPKYIKESNIYTISKIQKYIKNILFLPIYGSFIFNVYCLLNKVPFFKNGRYLLACQIANYVNISTTKDIDDLTIETKTINSYNNLIQLSEMLKKEL